MSGRSFADFVRGTAPWWLQRRVGGTLLESFGTMLDRAAETLLEGRNAANPLKCGMDAIPYHCEDRGIRNYPTEPEASIRQRLTTWRQAARLKGSHHGELKQLQPYFLPNTAPVCRIVHQNGDGTKATWHTINADGAYYAERKEPSNWDWDGAVDHWARFWVIIHVESLSYSPAEYDDGTNYDDGVTVWGGGPSAAQIADIVQLIADHQALHSWLWGVLTARGGGVLDPTATPSTDPDGWTTHPSGNWGYSIDATTGLPSRDPRIELLYDRGPL